MRKMMLVLAAAAAATALPAAAQNLLTNGDFEASSSETSTPPGWTNVGHTEGVIAYSVFNTPAYDGNYFYDLGGYGDPFGPAGDGIEQSVATVMGSVYTLTFGLSSENFNDAGRLDVYIGDQLTSFDLDQDTAYGELGKPFTTQSITYTALGDTTLIRFLIGEESGGNNDPLIDGVSFTGDVGGTVPEPATWALMILGFGAVGGAMRRRSTKVAFPA